MGTSQSGRWTFRLLSPPSHDQHKLTRYDFPIRILNQQAFEYYQGRPQISITFLTFLHERALMLFTLHEMSFDIRNCELPLRRYVQMSWTSSFGICLRHTRIASVDCEQ